MHRHYVEQSPYRFPIDFVPVVAAVFTVFWIAGVISSYAFSAVGINIDSTWVKAFGFTGAVVGWIWLLRGVNTQVKRTWVPQYAREEFLRYVRAMFVPYLICLALGIVIELRIFPVPGVWFAAGISPLVLAAALAKNGLKNPNYKY